MLGSSSSGSGSGLGFTSEPFDSTTTHSSDNISDVVRSEPQSDSDDQPPSPLSDEKSSDRHSDAQSQFSLRCDEDVSTSERSSQDGDSGLGDSGSEEYQQSNMPPGEEEVWKEALESLFPGFTLRHLPYFFSYCAPHRITVLLG